MPLATSRAFTIMTYNVGNGLARPQALADALRASQADVIGLQELSHAQADALGDSIADVYPHQVLWPAGIPGKGLLSKFPVAHAEQIEIHPRRPDLVTSLSIDSSELRVIVAHPPPPRVHLRQGIIHTEHGGKQFAHLVQIASSGEPTILLGDFNMRENNYAYAQLINAGLIDAFRQVGAQGFTFPTRRGRVRLRPVLRLDYIWHSTHLTPLEARIGSDAGSDHLPLLVDMLWPAAPADVDQERTE